MVKSLVIVESPAKAKTINKYLGNDYIVKSSVGHIRDLPTSSVKVLSAEKVDTSSMSKSEKEQYKKAKAYRALVARMGIDPEQNWQAHYEILSGKEKVVQELKKIAEKADAIYLATDLDREGEAIAWHLQEVIGGAPERYHRVVFNEITQVAIQEAFKQPTQLDRAKVDAQQARRFLDRIVGFMVSPLLWKKIARGLSAGRVQSVAVRLVVEREKEIKAFQPTEYWDIHADLQHQTDSMRLQVVKYQQQAFKPVNQAETDVAIAALQAADFQVASIAAKATQSKPSAPYITSTLQQAASSRLGFGVKKTMMLAQRLYEAGHITYMRTDSTNLSADAVQQARDFIQQTYGTPYLPKSPITYGSKTNAQEAHEAIRPSDASIESGLLVDMEVDAKRLYDLIWRQFIACQMTPAAFDITTLWVEAGAYQLKTKGRMVRFDGWTRVQPQQKKNEDDVVLPDLAAGTLLTLKALDPKQHFTKPVARFGEASLVKELEKRGIGRPSTYAAIISTIQDRGYVRIENKRFYAEKMGEIVNERLVENFQELMSYDFTAAMEKNLDDIDGGRKHWKEVLDVFYQSFQMTLEKADLDESQGGMRPNAMVMTDIKCPTCERLMGVRTATTGVFLGCSGYQLPPKERCKQTMNLIRGHDVEATVSEEAENAWLRQQQRCDLCGSIMDDYLIDEHRKIHICGQNPQCPGFAIEAGHFKIKGYDGPLLECDKCQHDMELKTGRFGKYFGCTNPECKNTRKLLRSGEPAPPKEDPIPLPELPCAQSDAYFMLRDGAAGIFLAAHTFPKSRETRAPLVEELVRFKDKIWPKYQYLVDAPTEDNDGNKTVVKFSRKTKEQYVASEIDRKATGWQAYYVDGLWQVATKTKKGTARKTTTRKGSKAKAKK